MRHPHSEIETITGQFKIGGGRKVFGSLHINRAESKLSLFDDIPFPSSAEDYEYVEGELYDGRFVSLIQGINMGSTSRFSAAGARKYSHSIFPHFITLGPAHVDPAQQCVEEISFVMKDAHAIFHDVEAFDTVMNANDIAPALQEAISDTRTVKFGQCPTVAYFTGNFEIASISTSLGDISVQHRPSVSPGGPKGVRMDNSILVTLQPPSSLKFPDVIASLQTLLRFFGLIAGRHQTLDQLMLTIAGHRPNAIQVHRSFDASSSHGETANSELHVRDVLVSTLHDQSELERTLQQYLALEDDRHDARIRFHSSIIDSSHYTIDRLVAAANMFDILPDSTYPANTELTPEILEAKREARRIFKALPDSFERSSILGALGRIGHLSLKHKIMSRVASTYLDKYFPGLDEVLKEAVNCRNHYVHGSRGGIDYSRNTELIMFFTDALEFSFAASDLIDCGWKFTRWRDAPLLQNHPFAKFVANYQNQLQRLHVVKNSRPAM